MIKLAISALYNLAAMALIVYALHIYSNRADGSQILAAFMLVAAIDIVILKNKPMRPKDEFYWRDLEPYWTRDGDDPGRVEDKPKDDPTRASCERLVLAVRDGFLRPWIYMFCPDSNGGRRFEKLTDVPLAWGCLCGRTHDFNPNDVEVLFDVVVKSEQAAIQGDEVPKTSAMKESKFLKQADLPAGRGTLVTVAGCEQHNMALSDAPRPDMKWALRFEEFSKPMVLNTINIQLCEQILGSDDTDDWVGKRLVLYVDPNVMFKGQIVGGLRVRAPKVQQATSKLKAKPEPEPEPDYDEDVDGEAPF